MATEAAWMALQWPGMEHVTLSGAGGAPDADVTGAAFGPRAEGRMILADPAPLSVTYVLTCDPIWRFRTLTVTVAGAGRSLALANDDGRWLANGAHRPDLDGCVDIDINRTPLTNTLPIRRLDWSAARSYDIEVAYVSVPELDVERARQRYTRLADAASGCATFRYESGSFSADLEVDGGSVVLDYPGLWRRLGAEAVVAG
jgi:uncharacterized protein